MVTEILQQLEAGVTYLADMRFNLANNPPISSGSLKQANFEVSPLVFALKAVLIKSIIESLLQNANELR